MDAETKLVIVSRQTVKPSAKSSNQIHTLSFFDQLSPRLYIPLVFFYSVDAIHVNNFTTNQAISLLRDSLSATLSAYYPLAGRIINSATVDCNDEGVVFIEAEMSCELSKIVRNPTDQSIRLTFPDNLQFKDSILSGPLVVQVTLFTCGGIAVSVCMCHKILDMGGMCLFLKSWAARARGSDEETVYPEFNFGSLFPPRLDLTMNPVVQPGKETTCVSRRFVFDALNIGRLKAIVAEQVENPTRVEVVTALLYLSAISASGFEKPTVLHQAVNLRSRVTPPFAKTSAGNLTGTYAVSTEEHKEIDLVWLVGEIRKARLGFCNSIAEKFREGNLCSFISDSSIGLRQFHGGKNEDVYACASWCRFPLYEIDFGWGKPFWVTSSGADMKNVIYTVDTKDGGGIEVIVTLEQHKMAVFEHDTKPTAFASVNPTIQAYKTQHY